MRVVFDHAGEFEACRAAERWCDARGISIGRAQHRAARGLLVGPYDIAKWRNLNAAERHALDGTMTGDMRHGPITINLNGAADDYPLLASEQSEHFAVDDES
jgi:hypothetical protein